MPPILRFLILYEVARFLVRLALAPFVWFFRAGLAGKITGRVFAVLVLVYLSSLPVLGALAHLFIGPTAVLGMLFIVFSVVLGLGRR